MALVLFDGFESAPVVPSTYTFNAGAGAATVGRDGVGKGIFINNSSTRFMYVPVSVASPTTIIGFGCNSMDASVVPLSLSADSGAVSHISISFSPTFQIRITRGSTQVAQSTALYSPGSWAYFEVKTTINDTTGYCAVKMNGVEVVSFTGDTRNGGTSMNIDRLTFGLKQGSYLDDLYVLDGTGSAPYNDWIGERVVKAQRPIGNGALSQFVGSDGNSVNNYELVDDDPLNVTDYVASSVPGDRDLYAMNAVSGLASVDAVQASFYASKSDSGTRSLKTLLRDGANTVQADAAVPLSTTWLMQRGAIKMTAPDGGAWTPAKVNDIQAGVECA